MGKMKLYLVSALFLCASLLKAQDIPLFSQKLVNSFIYNPSLAGVEKGAVTYLHKRGMNNLEGSGATNYLSFEAPVVTKNIGVGANALVEEINFLRYNHFSAAFAYHLDLGQLQVLSMGISAEYNSLKPDLDRVVGDVTDEMLNQLQGGSFNRMDFSAGIGYCHEFFVVGVGANRLATAFNGQGQESLLSQYYTVQIMGKLPMRQSHDLFEPVVSYRRFTKVSHLWDVGLYYTLKDMITIGGSIRIGGSRFSSNVENRRINNVGVTAAFKIIPELLLGYTMDIPANKTYQVGLMNEITLRYIFNPTSYQERFKRNGQPSLFRGRYKSRRK